MIALDAIGLSLATAMLPPGGGVPATPPILTPGLELRFAPPGPLHQAGANYALPGRPQWLEMPRAALSLLTPAVLLDVAPPPAVPPPAAVPAPAPQRSGDAAHGDPLHGFNRFSYRISQPFDRFVLHPIVAVYIHVIPRPLRDGARNFLANLFEPVVIANDLLQLRPRRALRTITRMVFNSTAGIAGIFDLARRKPFNLPDHPNGFADTLGFYGVGPGPYLYLPILGPTTFRDVAGGIGDQLLQPRLLGKLIHPGNHRPIYRSSLKLGVYGTIATVTGGLDERARADAALRAIASQSVDPYATLRSSYLQDRAGEIAELHSHDGAPATIPAFDDPLKDPEGAAPARH